MFQARNSYEGRGTFVWTTTAAARAHLLDLSRLSGHLDELGFVGFRGRFSEIEPDFDRFVLNYSSFQQRDAKTGLYGSWLNPLGRRDWWELGGRFNGVVTGEQLSGSDVW